MDTYVQFRRRSSNKRKKFNYKKLAIEKQDEKRPTNLKIMIDKAPTKIIYDVEKIKLIEKCPDTPPP